MNMLQILRKQHVLSIREFIHTLAMITSLPKNKKSPVYTITKNGKHVGTFIPAEYQEEVLDTRYISDNREKKYHSLFDRFDELAFSGDDPNLSMNIDHYVYGTKKKK
jgi:hypothetical protein